MPSTGFPSYTADTVAALNHRGLDRVPDIVSDTASETFPRVGDGETGPIKHLAQELAEQLIKFHECCNKCHQAARSHHIEDPSYHISLAKYLVFTPKLGLDILSSDTIAHQKDDLTGKLSPNPKDRLFIILTLKKVPYIYLDSTCRIMPNGRVIVTSSFEIMTSNASSNMVIQDIQDTYDI